MLMVRARSKIWQKLAQTAPAAPTTSTPVPAANTTTPPVASPVNITQIPTFKASLFSEKPEFIGDLTAVANLLNKYLVSLSNGQIDLNETWIAPSVNQDQFSKSLKNIYALAKWLYNIVSFNGPPYSLEGMRKIISDLVASTQHYDFPEASVSSIKEQITTLGNTILNKLGK
jgi:hypothetical protein